MAPIPIRRDSGALSPKTSSLASSRNAVHNEIVKATGTHKPVDSKHVKKKTNKNKTSNKVVSAASSEQSKSTLLDNSNLTYSVSKYGLNGYRWNLPPHKWSLPVEPSDDPMTVNSAAYSLGSLSKYRRGRIYWYSRVDSNYVDSDTFNTGKGGHINDPRYGFQFLWNPSSIQTSVSVNMDITPSFADKFVSVVGAFPSGEYLSFTLRIDRTNDFACIKSIPTDAPSALNTGSNSQGITTYERMARRGDYAQYYSAIDAFDYGFGDDLSDKIIDLQKFGTIADLEYLYKAINGPGWKNQATGRETSDIGFLMPTLLRIDVGPLSYLGYVNNITVVHNRFTKAMVPIETDVNVQFNLMATAGLSSK